MTRFKLTWQPRRHGAGRWKKIYQGKTHYFPGGQGKSDREAYQAALTAWGQLKVALDAEAAAAKPYKADYESAISSWANVLAWGQAYEQPAIVEKATAKIAELQTRLSMPSPRPVSLRGDQPISRLGMTAGMLMFPGADVDKITSGEAYQVAELLNVPEEMFEHPENLQKILNTLVEKKIWQSRLQLESNKTETAPDEYSAKFWISKFVKKRRSNVTAGGSANLNRHLNYFGDMIGQQSDVRKISAQTFDDLHNTLLSAVNEGTFGPYYAHGVLTSVRAFMSWLYEMEILEELPRNLLSKSLRIVVPAKQIKSFSVEQVGNVYKAASEPMRLYILLALNCGMTQIDISELRPSDINWQKGTLSRKRGKTQKFESVPVVIYALWPETLHLLKKLRSDDPERLLLGPGGGPLKTEIERDGKIAKNDYIGQKFSRLMKKLNVSGQFKMLKKTSASLLRDHATYNGLESLFLDHAPRSTSDKHYAQVPTKLLGEAVTWLRGQYKLTTRTQIKSKKK